jgi:hypothetical protein
MVQLSRRRAIAIGLGLGAAAGAGWGVRALLETQEIPDGPAYEAWRGFRDEPGRAPSDLVRAAVLAASAHNTQPWRFCAAADRIELFADPDRNLGAMDPFRREMHLSLGCALENLLIATAHDGYAARLTLGSGTLTDTRRDSAAVAVLALSRGEATASPLAAAIPRRHTNRGPYDPDRPVPAEALLALAGLADDEQAARLFLLPDKAARADFAAATVAATEEIINDATMIRDSDAWFRLTAADVAAHRDGPTLEASGLSPTVLWLAKLLPAPTAERSHSVWLERTRDVQLATAAAVGLIAVRDLYDVEQTLRAGRLWQRLHLQGTLLGLAMQPINQLPEIVDRQFELGKSAIAAATLASLTGDASWRPTFAFRLGWPIRVASASPRRDIQSVMMQSVMMSAGCRSA